LQQEQLEAIGLHESTDSQFVPVLPGKKQVQVLEQAVPERAAYPRRLQLLKQYQSDRCVGDEGYAMAGVVGKTTPLMVSGILALEAPAEAMSSLWALLAENRFLNTKG
jgi:hypothetical protein